MPTDTQRAPTVAECHAVGNDIDAAIVAHARAFALLQGAADRAMDDSRHDAEADDLRTLTDSTYNALIIAIAKRVREGEEPDCYSYEDYSWRADEDLGYIEVSDGVVEVSSYRYTGQRWAAQVPVASEDGERECELCYFDSEAEVIAALKEAAHTPEAPHA